MMYKIKPSAVCVGDLYLTSNGSTSADIRVCVVTEVNRDGFVFMGRQGCAGEHYFGSDNLGVIVKDDGTMFVGNCHLDDNSHATSLRESLNGLELPDSVGSGLAEHL